MESLIFTTALLDGPIVFQLRNKSRELEVVCPPQVTGALRWPVQRAWAGARGLSSERKALLGSPLARITRRQGEPEGLLGKGRAIESVVRGVSGLHDLPAWVATD